MTRGEEALWFWVVVIVAAVSTALVHDALASPTAPVFNAEHASQCRAIEGMARTRYEAREALMLCRWQAPTPAEMEGIIRWRARHGQR